MRPMVRRSLFATLIAPLAACISGEGMMASGNQAGTNLNQANYRVMKQGARGQDTGFYFLGFIPIVSPTYADAMSDLREGLMMEGKAVSFVNVTQDRTNFWFIVFSLPRITVSADAIEFVESPR